MYPEFADMYEFVDFEEFKIEGGASPLTKIVRAFAGVRMTQRIIALFDNDAAGLEQKALLDKGRLPQSIRTMNRVFEMSLDVRLDQIKILPRRIGEPDVLGVRPIGGCGRFSLRNDLVD